MFKFPIMALGAHKRDVFRMVVGQGLALALAGLAIGVVAALILTRVLSSFSLLLYGVGASDPATFITVSVMLLFEGEGLPTTRPE